MAKKHHVEQPFKYFPFDTKDPIGKFKQPVELSTEGVGNGYPQTGIDNDDVTTYNRVTPWTKKKVREDARGTGAMERGKKFVRDDKFREINKRWK